MIKYNLFKQYGQTTDGLRFTFNIAEEKPFMLTYFSENSLLMDDFEKLHIRPMDVRLVVFPKTRIPRMLLTNEIKKVYKSLGLYSYPSNGTLPPKKSFIYDISNYINEIDRIYRPSNYRQRAGILMKNQLDAGLVQFQNYKRIFIYSIDITKPFHKNFIDRRIFPIIQQIKNGEIYFDDFVLALVNESSVRYRLLIKDRKHIFARTLNYLKTVRYISKDEEEIEQDEDHNEATEKVVKELPKTENPEKIKDAVKSYLKKDPKTMDDVLSGELTSFDLKKVAAKSVIFKATNDIQKSNMMVKNVKPEKIDKLVTVVDKNYADQLLPKENVKNTSDDKVVASSDLKKMVDNKNPNHLFVKRQVDFQTNLKNDMTNSFKTLETKEIPLKVEKVEILDKPERKNEIAKSDLNVIRVTLKDEFGKVHHVSMEIPKIDPNSGTFRVNGRTKCLINQIILCPITFPKLYDSKFESSYSAFHIHSKRSKRSNWLEIYMGSFKRLPLLILLSFSFGFDEIMKQYKISYSIKTEKPKKTDKYVCKINSSEYIYFENVDSEVKIELVNSLINEGIDDYIIKQKFGTHEYFKDLIIKITGRVNSTFLITSNLENIVDPVAKQVLINKGLPYDLQSIFYYMATKVVTGIAEPRNDLNNQRIRGSEVLVHLAQKQILSAYTVYKEQVLAGNKNAEFIINPTKVASQFINSEIVVDMEYANPIEEMAVMTRVSPVGKSIGGIPDQNAIQISARNLNKSYFGNIDPLDTPEGGNIGISQQLAIDAMITSARGLFSTKDVANSEGSGILSTSCSMIPFIENNDGARIIMAANQSRQMLPLKNPQPPVVRSGYESILTNVLSDNFVKKAPENAKVLEVTNEHIIILTKSGQKQIIDLSPIHLRSGTGRDTLSIFKPMVKKGDVVAAGKILAEGSCVKDGEISLGRTLCLGFMPYKGYNFEDGVVINEKLAIEDKLTSLHGIEVEVLISEKDRVLFISGIGERTEKGQPILRKTIGEIEQLIGFDEEDESEVRYGQELIKNSPGGLVVDIEVFCNVDDSRFPILKPYIDKTRKRYGVSEDQKFTEKGISIKGAMVRFKIEQELRINVGDKLCNRFGNKGIISLMEKDENMPRTPWGDKLDIILNPIGVIGRMNLGQLYELYCGLISRSLALSLIRTNDRKQFTTYLSSVLSKLDTSINNEFTTKLIATISKMSESEFGNLVNKIRNDGFVPIIVPPFKAPKPNQIIEALKTVNLETGYNLYLPEFGVKTVNKVPVGYMYISKLEHIGEMKIHSRSTGPLVGKTSQPTGGKRKEGGQRLGEADVHALISYNCPKLLTELMGGLSDDLVSKNEMISEIIQNGETSFKIPKISPAKDLLNSYFISLMLERN